MIVTHSDGNTIIGKDSTSITDVGNVEDSLSIFLFHNSNTRRASTVLSINQATFVINLCENSFKSLAEVSSGLSDFFPELISHPLGTVIRNLTSTMTIENREHATVRIIRNLVLDAISYLDYLIYAYCPPWWA